MRHVPARTAMSGLGPDVSLGHGDVPDHIPECEGPRLVAPFDAIVWDAGRHAPGPLAPAVDVADEIVQIEHGVAICLQPRFILHIGTVPGSTHRFRLTLERLQAA